MKKKTKKIVIIASSVIAFGVITVGASFAGYALSQNISNDYFKNVVLKDKEVIYDGTPHNLDIVVPDNISETHIIRNSNNEVVAECVKTGIYTYFVDLKCNDVVKKCEAKLTIIDSEDNNLNISDDGNLSLMSVKMARITADQYKVTATITPSYYADAGVKWELYWANKDSEWANGKNVVDYLDLVNNNDLSSTITRKNYFGEQIVLKGTCNYDNSMFATASIDCEKKLLESELILNEVTSESYTDAISSKIVTIVKDSTIKMADSNTYSDFTIDKEYSPHYSYIFKDLSFEGKKLIAGQEVTGTYYFKKEYDLTSIYSKYIVNGFTFNLDNFKTDIQKWYNGLSYDEKSTNFIFKYSPFLDDEDTAHNGTDILTFYDIYAIYDSLTVNMNKFNVDSETKTLGIKIKPIVSTSFDFDTSGIVF
jgi:hypothetical protein